MRFPCPDATCHQLSNKALGFFENMQWHAIAKFTWRLHNSVDKSLDRHTNFSINYFLDFDNLFNCYNLFNNSFNRHFFFNDSLNDSVHVFDGWHFSYLLRDGRSPPHRMQNSFENTDRPLLHGLDVLLNEVIVIQRSSVRPNSPQYPFHRSLLGALVRKE